MVRALSIQDFEFSNVVVECESAHGVRFPRLVRTGMPKITSNAIKCVFYLYRTEKEARVGLDPQGTGFLVCVASTISGVGYWRAHTYAVTSWHLAVDDSKDHPPSPVIRLRRRNNGEPHVISLTKDDWRFIPGLDVAVAAVDLDDDTDALAVPVDMLLRPAKAKYLEIGVGDDVFMMGLFVDHHGGATNVPAARFGNISMVPNPDALLPQGGLPDIEGCVLDMHSRDGFSGSPVFVYRTFGSDLTVPISEHFHLRVDPRRSPYGSDKFEIKVEHETVFELLGIHYAQFPEEFDSEKAGVITGLSGMTCAIPAGRILDVLNLQEFIDMREKRDAELAKQAKKRPKLEKAKKPQEKELPEGDREAFKRLLGAAVRSPKSSG